MKSSTTYLGFLTAIAALIPFGAHAKGDFSALIKKSISCKKPDEFGKTTCHLRIGDDTDVELSLVGSGSAAHIHKMNASKSKIFVTVSNLHKCLIVKELSDTLPFAFVSLKSGKVVPHWSDSECQ